MTEIFWKKEATDPEGCAPRLAHTRDISAGGLCIEMDAEISAGDTLLLEIRMASGRTIYTRGRVAWINPLAQIKGWVISSCEGGVELLNLSESEQTEIDFFSSQPFQDQNPG